MKRILITGATDGIGLETVKQLISLSHHVLLHGRSSTKLEALENSLPTGSKFESFVADLSSAPDVERLAAAVAERHDKLDVVINNAGVFAVKESTTPEGIDVRFMVNTIAPYLLTKRLLPLLDETGRVINLSSAAQAPVSIDALLGNERLSDGEAYAQSKLAITMWSRGLARSVREKGPVIIAVNPGSMLGSKMVKEAYGVSGKDIQIGAEILSRAALSDDFATASGQYFDNDSGRFASPHPDALDEGKISEVVDTIEGVIEKIVKS